MHDLARLGQGLRREKELHFRFARRFAARAFHRAPVCSEINTSSPSETGLRWNILLRQQN